MLNLDIAIRRASKSDLGALEAVDRGVYSSKREKTGVRLKKSASTLANL
jgi:hypothetical protein